MSLPVSLPVSLWGFAVETYARPGVRERLLELQDAHGQCVSLLLWRLWLARAGREPADPDGAVAAARAMEHEILGPLRSVRRRLREGPAALAPEARRALHGAVSEAELAAERSLLEALEALSTAQGRGRPPASALAEIAAAWGAPAPAPLLAELVAAC